MNNIFSNNMKKFRLQKNYTQAQVADVLGISSHTVSRWECGTTLPDVLLLPEIAKLYEDLGDFKKAYETFSEMADILCNRSYDVEAQMIKQRAKKCLEKLNKENKQSRQKKLRASNARGC